MEALVQQAVEESILKVAKQAEDQLDNQIRALENLEDDDLERMRQARIDQLKRQAQQREQWRARGHGSLREIDSEKDFFAEMKGEDRMICHFYRENWPCKVMDKHLQILAQEHLETKFVKINAEKAPFLTDRLKIWMLPTLALIKHEKTTDYVVGFDELGGRDDFQTELLEARLIAAGLLHPSAAQVAAKPPPKRAIRQTLRTDSDEDSDFD
eukprot:jgi/Botrbrau1/22029/Bobra.0024s0043.1